MSRQCGFFSTLLGDGFSTWQVKHQSPDPLLHTVCLDFAGGRMRPAAMLGRRMANRLRALPPQLGSLYARGLSCVRSNPSRIRALVGSYEEGESFGPVAEEVQVITVNGERVWVPNSKSDLIDGLKRMGIHKDAGIPLRRQSKKRLMQLYCREARRIKLRQQGEYRCTDSGPRQRAKPTSIQLPLF